MNQLKAVAGAVLVAGFTAVSAQAGEMSNDDKIAHAMSAAPANVSAEAKIIDMDGTVLREGDNGWTCMAGGPPNYEDPMCLDEVWMGLIGALMNQQPYESVPKVGFSYMLAGDRPVDNDDPYGQDTSVHTWVKEGPHLMVLLPKEMLEGIQSDPYGGGPYVMWGDSDYAHIMIPLEVTEPYEP